MQGDSSTAMGDKPPAAPSSLGLLLLPHCQSWRESWDGPAQLQPHQGRLRYRLMRAGEERDRAVAAEPAASSRNHGTMGEFGLEGTLKGHLVQPLQKAGTSSASTFCQDQSPGDTRDCEWCPYSSIPRKGCLETAQVETSGFPALGVPGTPSLHSRAPYSSSLKHPSPAVSLLPWSCWSQLLMGCGE